MALPQFFIAGVPKAGTTGLYAALAGHPQLYLPAVKEPKFFLSDGTWLLIRASGTEPLVRVYTEATSAELREAMLQVAKTGEGPAEQVPSVGCSIKWRH